MVLGSDCAKGEEGRAGHTHILDCIKMDTSLLDIVDGVEAEGLLDLCVRAQEDVGQGDSDEEDFTESILASRFHGGRYRYSRGSCDRVHFEGMPFAEYTRVPADFQLLVHSDSLPLFELGEVRMGSFEWLRGRKKQARKQAGIAG